MQQPASAPTRTGSRALRALLVLFLVIVVLVAVFLGFYLWSAGASGPSEPVTVAIPAGATTSEIGAILEDAGVIRSGFVFRLTVRLRGLGGFVEAGEYELRTNMSLDEAVDALQGGPVPEDPPPLSITIPEGFRLEQVAERVKEELGIERRAFTSVATSGDFARPPYLPAGTPSVEGFLFPKTYEFEEGVEADAVIDRLLDQFELEAENLPWGRAQELGVTEYEVVVIASMIEREAKVPGDRKKIAAVIYNRLALGMALEIDATVQYALPKQKESLTFDDLEVDSPYNTYLHTGLPPGPIASPGVASLRAALRPADVDYLYFVVVDESGRHGFTASYDEFLRLKDEAAG